MLRSLNNELRSSMLRERRRMGSEIPEEALECVMSYVNDPRDRSVVSQVCKQWYMMDALTRKHVTVAFCYTIRPADLTRRFKRLESLKLKGKPRADMFNLIQEDWGAYARPWITEISSSCLCLKSLHLRRMVVKDDDLTMLVRSHGHMLQALKLERCSGFSTLGLLEIARSCRSLKVLLLEASMIKDEGGEWLHELALRNSSLEVLNFYETLLDSINIGDIELIATNCLALTSLRVNECYILDLKGVLEKATELEEFGGGSFVDSEGHALESDAYQGVKFPSKVISLIGLNFMSGLPFILPRACNLKKLDLQFTLLSTENHCELLRLCTNLEVLEFFTGLFKGSKNNLPSSVASASQIVQSRSDLHAIQIRETGVREEGEENLPRSTACHLDQKIFIFYFSIAIF